MRPIFNSLLGVWKCGKKRRSRAFELAIITNKYVKWNKFLKNPNWQKARARLVGYLTITKEELIRACRETSPARSQN